MEPRAVKRPAPGNSLLNGRFGDQRLEASPARQRYEIGVPHETLNGYRPSVDRFEGRRNGLDEESVAGPHLEPGDSQVSLGRKRGKAHKGGRKFTQPPLPAQLDAERFHQRIDPYDADPETTIYFLKLFFHHRNASPYVIWPREKFLGWTRDCRSKSPDDLMVLYALMAFGSIFSLDQTAKDIGEKCYKVAFALERERADQPSLQMMQARSALLLFNFAKGNFEGTFEYTAHAIRTATSMRYTDENRVSDINEEQSTFDFDMNASQIKECRRRSFYITYFIDVSHVQTQLIFPVLTC